MIRFITAFTIFTVVASEQAGRRRRRSLYHQKPCGPGTYAVLSKTKRTILSCEGCPDNTYRADEKHSQENCVTCPAGRISNDNKSLCTGEICLAGKYGTAGSIICNECNIGEYSEKGAFHCNKCESGRYNASPGNSNCLGEKCKPGTFGLIGQSKKSHTTCRVSIWKMVFLWSYGMFTCPDGKYSKEGSGKCEDHDSCPGYSYYKFKPLNTNRHIECEICIYYSTIYTIGFFFSCFVVCSILMTCLYSINENGWVMFLVIAPTVCIIVLARCSNKPSNNQAIVSIVVGVIFVLPLVLKLKNLVKKTQPKQIINISQVVSTV